jgi:DNA-binding winged helix-turn-helix (wHTH) protein/tetratricopeptide (TPR) repeat protein
MDPTPRYQLGPYLLEPATRVLSRGGAEVHLAQKPFLVLVHLVEHRHRLVTRAELLERFWSGGDVYDQALTRCLSHIRKALDDQSDPPKFIETRWAEGYRYIGPFEPLAAATIAPAATPPPASSAATDEDAEFERPDPVAPHRDRRWPWAVGFALLAAFAAGMLALRVVSAPDLDGLRRIAVSARFAGPADDAWLAEPLPAQVVRTVSRIEGIELVTGEAVRDGSVDAMLDLELALDATQLTLRARLIAQDGRPLWTYESTDPRADLMKAERHLMRALAARLSLPVREPPPRARSEASYLHLIRGLALLDDKGCGDAEVAQAKAEFAATLEADPGQPQALAALAEAEVAGGWCESGVDAAALARARTLAEQAARLDAGSARAQMVLGAIALAEGALTVARTHLDRAVDLIPVDAKAHRLRAAALCAQAQHLDCVREAAYAAALAPASARAAFDHAQALRTADKLEAALAVNAAARARWPQDPRFVAQQAELQR